MKQTVTINTGADFPMNYGDRLFIRYSDGAVMRLKVTDVTEVDKRKKSFAIVETVKYPARKHASSNAVRFGGQ